MSKTKALGGKGLESLFNISDMATFKSTVNEDGEVLVNIPVNLIVANPNQPRKDFDKESIQALAESIKEAGLLQPISVIEDSGEYTLVAGERRLRAVKLLGHETIKAIVVNADEKYAAELALIENLQREDLNALDEAEAYDALIKQHKITHERLSTLVGKSRAHISNYIRLLQLKKHELEALRSGSLTVGHAKVLLSIKDPALRQRVFKASIDGGITVRKAEAMASEEKKEKKPARKTKKTTDPDVKKIERRLEDTFGTKVKVANKDNGSGSITIEYYTKEDLDRVLDILFHVER